MNRIVLLGASNLTLAFPRIARLAAGGFCAEPLKVLAAAGHGRAYALPSRALWRHLPPIATCGLWRELERQPAQLTRALVADVGNDLGFGAEVEEVVEAVGRCLRRLRAAGSETTIVMPPLAGIERLSPRRFVILRSILFPGRKFDQGAIIRRLGRLAAELRALAEGVGADTVEVDPDWLGGDGIHIRWRRQAEAWGSLLAGWRPATGEAALPARLRWSWLRADRAGLLAVRLRHRQPCRRFARGGTLSLY